MSDDYDPHLESTVGNHSPAAATQAAETLRAASQRVSDAIDPGREPGMPLDTIRGAPRIHWRSLSSRHVVARRR